MNCRRSSLPLPFTLLLVAAAFTVAGCFLRSDSDLSSEFESHLSPEFAERSDFESQYSSFEKRSAYVTLSDETQLAVDVFLPRDGPAQDRFPTILQYTPYNRAWIDPRLSWWDRQRLRWTTGHRDGARQFLYAWMGDVDRDPATGELGPGQDSDFLAVYDVDPASPSYGEVVSTLPVNLVGSLPHHTEYRMPAPGEHLFANAHLTEDVLMFNLADPLNPRLAGILDPVPPLRFPHDMVPLPNGNVLVGYLRSDGPSPVPGDSQVPGGHGGFAEFTRAGDLVRWASAADSSLAQPVRPYSFAVLPEIDRLIVSSAFMMENHSADVVQIWRLSDLTHLHTLPVPPARLPDGSLLRTRSAETGALEPTGHVGPAVLRVAHDGSVLFSTFGCGLYRITGLERDSPTVENVYTFAVPEEEGLGDCGIPVYTGRYWVMTIGEGHVLVSLDVHDPAEPRRVAQLETGPDFEPHWLAKDPRSDRLIVGAQGSGEDRMLMARLDPATGQLAWDETLRERNGLPGIDFRRASWPHGETGLAFAHAALFQR